MASKIKGITVEIGGDTTGLDKALSGVNKQLGSTQSELKTVERQLKFDPTNTVLLSQKQELLKDAISKASDKLKTLESVQSQVEAQFKSGDIDGGAYREFQRELEKTKSQLDDLKNQKDAMSEISSGADNTKSAFENLRGVLSNVKSDLETVTSKAGSALATAGKVGIETVGTATKMAAKGFEAYTATVAAAATAASAYAISVGSDFESQMSTVQSISGASAEELEALTEKAKEMGQTTQFSATEAAQGMEYMAMAGWNTAEITDGLAGVMNLAAASGEDLATTSDIVTDAMTAFGMSADESDRFADVLAKTASSANTNVSLMGATFKNVAPLAGAMNYNIEDMSVAIGLMANAGVKGEKAGTSLKNIITNLADPTDEAVAAMNDLGVSLVDSEGNTKSFEAVVGELRTGFDGLTEAEKAQYASTIAGKEGMSGLLAIVNSSEEDYQSLSESINNCSGAAEEMANTRLDNLKGDVTLLKSNVEGTALALYEDLSPGLREVVQGTNDLVTAFNEGGVDALVEKIPVVVGNMLTSLSTSLQTKVPEILSAVNAVLSTVLTTLAVQAPDLINSILPALLGGFLGLVQALVDTVPTLVPTIADGAMQLFTGLLDGLNQVVEQLMPMFPDLIQQITDILIENLPTIIEGGFQLLIGLITGITDCIPDLIDAVVALIPVVTDALIENLPKLVDAGLQLIVALATGLPQAIPTLIEAIPDIIKAIIDTFAQTDWGEIGMDILEGVGKGLWNGIDSLIDTVGDICGDIWDNFCDFWGIHSPSRKMAGAGVNMAQGIGVGFDDEIDDVNAQMQRGVQSEFNVHTNLTGSASGSAVSSATSVQPLNGGLPDKWEINLSFSDTDTFARAVFNPLDALMGNKVQLGDRGLA